MPILYKLYGSMLAIIPTTNTAPTNLALIRWNENRARILLKSSFFHRFLFTSSIYPYRPRGAFGVLISASTQRFRIVATLRGGLRGEIYNYRCT